MQMETRMVNMTVKGGFEYREVLNYPSSKTDTAYETMQDFRTDKHLGKGDSVNISEDGLEALRKHTQV